MVELVMSRWIAHQLSVQRFTYLPDECCAILLGRQLSPGVWKAENVCPIENTSSKGEFVMEPQQQMNITSSVKDGGGNKFVEIVAHYHSHPRHSLGQPSSIDLAEAKKGWKIGLHLIEGVDGLNAFEWTGKEFKTARITLI